MGSENEKHAAYDAWQVATKALQRAIYPSVGHQSATYEETQALLATLEQKLAAFKAAYGL